MPNVRDYPLHGEQHHTSGAADSATVERHEPSAAGRPPDRRHRVRRPRRRDPADRGRPRRLRRDRARQTTSAAPGATTPTPAPAATSRASCTRTPSRRNPDWSRSFSPQPEIQAYLQRTAREYGVLDKILFGTESSTPTWDDEAQRLARRHDRTATFARTAGHRAPAACPSRTCPRSRASSPSRARSSTPRAGTTTSTSPASGWRSSAPAPRRSRSSPRWQQAAAHLDVYQRTAPWVMPRSDRPLPTDRAARVQARAGARRRLAREASTGAPSCSCPASPTSPRLCCAAQKARDEEHRARHHRPRAARGGHARLPDRLQADPDLQHLLPDARRRQRRPGHRRHRRDPPNAIVTTDGTVREVDAIVVATGFYTTDSPTSERIVGRDGRTLADVWREASSGLQGHDRPRLPQPAS